MSFLLCVEPAASLGARHHGSQPIIRFGKWFGSDCRRNSSIFCAILLQVSQNTSKVFNHSRLQLNVHGPVVDLRVAEGQQIGR
jgi:hypothetical protein